MSTAYANVASGIAMIILFGSLVVLALLNPAPVEYEEAQIIVYDKIVIYELFGLMGNKKYIETNKGTFEIPRSDIFMEIRYSNIYKVKYDSNRVIIEIVEEVKL